MAWLCADGQLGWLTANKYYLFIITYCRNLFNSPELQHDVQIFTAARRSCHLSRTTHERARRAYYLSHRTYRTIEAHSDANTAQHSCPHHRLLVVCHGSHARQLASKWRTSQSCNVGGNWESEETLNGRFVFHRALRVSSALPTDAPNSRIGVFISS